MQCKTQLDHLSQDPNNKNPKLPGPVCVFDPFARSTCVYSNKNPHGASQLVGYGIVVRPWTPGEEYTRHTYKIRTLKANNRLQLTHQSGYLMWDFLPEPAAIVHINGVEMYGCAFTNTTPFLISGIVYGLLSVEARGCDITWKELGPLNEPDSHSTASAEYTNHIMCFRHGMAFPRIADDAYVVSRGSLTM